MRLPKRVPMKAGQMLNAEPDSSPSSSLSSSSSLSCLLDGDYLSLCGLLTMTCSIRGVLSILIDLVADLFSASPSAS